ncbi:MAG: LacI family DNA-binding transcriptional regulator [Verrucomicrobia bacterium]|nr:LacI family DNA-binding transcriptional regulator [Verrucomicrobiota bacterium]
MITLKDIATEVGVSLAAASMAMNDHPSISRHTKSRVWEVQRRLGYRPNRHARLLRRRPQIHGYNQTTTGNIAFLLIDRTFEDPVYAPLFQGVFDGASTAGLHLFYHSLKREDLRAGRLPQLIRDHEVDGLVISGVCEEAEYRVLKEMVMPRILLGVYDVGESVMAVESDIEQGMRIVLERLAAFGHRRVAFISENLEIHTYRLMRQTFETESRRLWRKFDPDLIQMKGAAYEGGREATGCALRLKERPTALVLATERLAAAAYDLCAEMKLQIPADCSIAAFGSGGHFYHYHPALTLVSADSAAMGRAAVNNLLESLAQSSAPPHRSIFPIAIREGQSWGQAPS